MKSQILAGICLSLVPSGAGAALTQEDFNQVIDRVEGLYPVTEKGEKITVNRLWMGSAIGDHAIRIPVSTLENPVVAITGTAAKDASITKDAFAMVVCHEFGHHLAKGPRIGFRKLESWSAAEGEADYWATSKCLKAYFSKYEDKESNPEDLPLELKGRCEDLNTDPKELFQCYRASAAVVSLSKYLVDKNKSQVDFSSKAPAVKELVRRFRKDGFRDQCRVDTWLAGVYAGSSAAHGERPGCWYFGVSFSSVSI